MGSEILHNLCSQAPRPPPPVRLPPAIGRGRGRPPARTVGSQRRAATAPGGSQTGGRDGAGAQGQKRPAPAMMLALPPKRNPNLMVGGRPQVPERLDVDRMSLKDVIRWSNSKERETLLAEKQRKVGAWHDASLVKPSSQDSTMGHISGIKLL